MKKLTICNKKRS